MVVHGYIQYGDIPGYKLQIKYMSRARDPAPLVLAISHKQIKTIGKRTWLDVNDTTTY